MRRRSSQHLMHGPRRLVLRPWRQVCRCGFGRWPCYPHEMLRRQATTTAIARVSVRWPHGRQIAAAAPLLTRGQATRADGGAR